MKITALLTVTNPEERQDPWVACLRSVLAWADEVVIVNGGKDLGLKFRSDEIGRELYRIKEVMMPWPYEWSWEELPKHLNMGLQEATGDWVVRVDADYVFEEGTRAILDDELGRLGTTPVATMQKFSSVLWNKFYQKGSVKMVINKKDASNVVFGKDKDNYTDLCVPIYWDMKTYDEKGIPVGQAVPDGDCGRTHVRVFNYDYTFKTKEFTADEFYRFSKAHEKYFGTTKWGHTPDESLQTFINMMRGRVERCVYTFGIDEQPTYIQQTLKWLQGKPELFGLEGWGLL